MLLQEHLTATIITEREKKDRLTNKVLVIWQTKPQRISQSNTSLPIHEGEAPVISPARVSYELCLGSCGLCDNGSLIILTTAVHRPPQINSHSRNIYRCATTSLNSLKKPLWHYMTKNIHWHLNPFIRRSLNCIKQPHTYIHTWRITPL